MSQDRAEQPMGGSATKLDTTVPHSARVWNYWLGGKDNFAPDREVGQQVRAVFPEIVEAARCSRAFLGRAVTYLAAEAGIRQFLDVGTGLPTAENTHEVAQRIKPEARVVYVDNDPMVLAHARVLLSGSQEGATQYVDADLRDPEKIIQDARETLDFNEPIALMMLGVMGHVENPAEARAIVNALVSSLPPGSFLAMSDGTATSERVIESHRQYNGSGALPYHLRGGADFTAFFDGLDLVEPGVVPLGHWRPDNRPSAIVDGYCGVARKL
ncbi:SAM-dependent methyltransferase [Micromonospora endolithica]|uniref:SAM-dependent methyltransferase n=1 Tax=Micromonospora endolithica TaxID=230091 RepID=A0A3A9ZD09_9ACTN|nr:SAM-dependent methyltransferase [Micromonospora endolithica]RKN45276.1 SAM-dependent methyltransferase [Micromonospora endolithica]TWJ23037.1 O-methyltransferase involved in polyketide biosynthesis [Micromonospora endolithica]